MKVKLIRHTSVDVPKGICYGQTDVPLKETFPEEAAVTHNRIATEKFDQVFTSPLSRCTRLAAFCGYPDAVRDDRLKELNFGEWEMQRFDEITDPRMQQWFNDYLNVPATGGESFMMQFQRISSFLDELKEQGHEHVAIFAHGGVLICAQIYAGILKLEGAFNSIPPYGEVIEIEI
ncbi:alpha-ribazole phosphatase [Bacteroides sp. 51]|uniref:alpha-ribazole phosphatase n=1 Tax=Bacteroides sp. 51 TaxID=2302938 RepID=UPI0013D37F9D|nr:alpha-ribazole phosphatase [Bacteroides sp. 51]NDV82010.1 alpha-ribazole phosphatase [Bacteroides sp. 51]